MDIGPQTPPNLFAAMQAANLAALQDRQRQEQQRIDEERQRAEEERRRAEQERQGQMGQQPWQPSTPDISGISPPSLNFSSFQHGVTGRPPSTPTGGGGMSNLAGKLTPLLYAYLIGKGKMAEHSRLSKNPDDPLGNFGLSMLGPSASQIFEDPAGMGLPTLIGLPFLTPFTGSDKAKGAAPEWGGLFSLLGG